METSRPALTAAAGILILPRNTGAGRDEGGTALRNGDGIVNDAANKIAFQGSLGAYSHMACLAVKPEMTPMPCRSFLRTCCWLFRMATRIWRWCRLKIRSPDGLPISIISFPNPVFTSLANISSRSTTSCLRRVVPHLTIWLRCIATHRSGPMSGTASLAWPAASYSSGYRRCRQGYRCAR